MQGELVETACFVAEALFNIYSAPALGGPNPFDPAAPNVDPIFQIAHNVALQIAGKPGYAINPTIASPLRLAILAHPTYVAFLKSHPIYPHDGVSL